MSRTGDRLVEPARAFTPGRIVALVAIGLLVLGLGYLRLAPGSGSVSVPAGAKAGDLILEPNDYATENGSYAADCGTLVVPEDRADPESRLIAVPVTRIRARSGQPAEPIFCLEGGPGITNTEFKYASRYAEDRDLVLVGYRGVDGSVRLDCPEVESALRHSSDLLGEKSFRAYADGFRACAERLTADGVDLAGYGMAQQVDDMEAARRALGHGRAGRPVCRQAHVGQHRRRHPGVPVGRRRLPGQRCAPAGIHGSSVRVGRLRWRRSPTGGSTMSSR